jgi:hypothetical protein
MIVNRRHSEIFRKFADDYLSRGAASSLEAPALRRGQTKCHERKRSRLGHCLRGIDPGEQAIGFVVQARGQVERIGRAACLKFAAYA